MGKKEQRNITSLTTRQLVLLMLFKSTKFFYKL